MANEAPVPVPAPAPAQIRQQQPPKTVDTILGHDQGTDIYFNGPNVRGRPIIGQEQMSNVIVSGVTGVINVDANNAENNTRAYIPHGTQFQISDNINHNYELCTHGIEYNPITQGSAILHPNIIYYKNDVQHSTTSLYPVKLQNYAQVILPAGTQAKILGTDIFVTFNVDVKVSIT